MQAASREYKALMRAKYRNSLSHVRVTIGVVNQRAQASAHVPDPDDYAYYGNLKAPLDNYGVEELYATCDEDYSAVDGSMYFLPRSRADVALNQGIVTEGLLGTAGIRFPLPCDVKGLTVEFGKAYPVDFRIESDKNTVEVSGNEAGHFVTEEVFGAATFLRFVPTKMINGRSRLRINQITMGIGTYFDGKRILSAIKKERVSPVSEELPTIDLELVIDNKNREYDIENTTSTINFLEVGQEVEVIYGQGLADGSVEWLPGAKLRLKEWSADDEEMSFSATDRFDGMSGTYRKGLYRPGGASLYDLAVDVLNDAGVDPRTVWIDNYLKDVAVRNPMPVVAHKEALQLIANAGRCVLYQDRSGRIALKSSFTPEMKAASANESYFSHAGAVLDGKGKKSYALASRDHADVEPTQYFLPRQTGKAEYLNTGYVSEAVAGADGSFASNPTLEITLEARYKCFGLTLDFGRNVPDSMAFHAFLAGEPREDYAIGGLEATTVVSHEFPEFDKLILEITRGKPYNRAALDGVTFGSGTDYAFEYGAELTRTPKGTQLPRVGELQVARTLYGQSTEIKELAKETITAAGNPHTFYLSQPAYDLSCALTKPQAGQTARIVSSGSYYATVELGGVTGAAEVSVTGREYVVTQALTSKGLNPTGTLEAWKNPLVSDAKHAEDIADWIGDYLRADRDYDLQYRGEPRIDANDTAYLENKYVPDLLLRIYDHTLKFNGALSGSIKARRDMSHVATAKDGLASRGLF